MEIENTETKKVTFVDKVNTFFQKPLHKLILIIVLTVLVILFLLLVFNVGNNIEQPSTAMDLDVYYYANNQYLEYNGKILIKKNDEGDIDLVAGHSNFDNIVDPIYFKNEDKVIFSTPVSVVIPTMGIKQNKVSSFSVIEKTSTNPIINNNDSKMEIPNAFIYNGVNTYLFVEDVTLILKKNKIELPAFSYVKCGYKDYLYVYNYETKEFKTYDNVDYVIYAQTLDYKINLSTDNLSLGDQSVILTKNIEKLVNIK